MCKATGIMYTIFIKQHTMNICEKKKSQGLTKHDTDCLCVKGFRLTYRPASLEFFFVFQVFCCMLLLRQETVILKYN